MARRQHAPHFPCLSFLPTPTPRCPPPRDTRDPACAACFATAPHVFFTEFTTLLINSRSPSRWLRESDVYPSASHPDRTRSARPLAESRRCALTSAAVGRVDGLEDNQHRPRPSPGPPRRNPRWSDLFFSRSPLSQPCSPLSTVCCYYCRLTQPCPIVSHLLPPEFRFIYRIRANDFLETPSPSTQRLRCDLARSIFLPPASPGPHLHRSTEASHHGKPSGVATRAGRSETLARAKAPLEPPFEA